jgi:hypothetical protein
MKPAFLISELAGAQGFRTAMLLCFFMAGCGTGFAQGGLGSVVGSVADQTGAAVAGATVTATNEGTQLSRSILSDAKGDYSIPSLNPGRYSVRAEKTGFQVALSNGMIVQVGQSTRVDFQLHLGAVTQTVEVTSSVPLLQTASSTIGQVIANEPVHDLPLNGRDFLSLAVLSPAAVTQQGNSLRINQTGKYAGANQPVIAGNRQDSVTITLDGFLDARPYDVTPVLRPSIDAIQEFKIESSNFTAESGRNPALIQIATKSGTNQLHGAVWDFVRNNIFDAREFFDATIAPLRRNQFGTEVAGPIVLPHFYNGKNKTFFLFNWESSRFRIGQTESANFIPPAFLQGDFSSLRNSQGNPIQLYDPTTTNPTTGLRQPFSGNLIPVNRFDPVALRMAQMFEPIPNSAGFPNTVGLIISPENNDQYTGRVDHQFGRNSIMGRFSWGKDNEHDPSLQPFGGQYAINTDLSSGLRWSYSIRPTLLNAARVGFLTGRTFLEQEAVQANRNLNAEAGIKNINFFPPFSYSVPLVGCSGSIYRCPTGGQSFKEISNVLEYGDVLTWSHGPHTLNFGLNIYRTRSVWASGGATGNWSFNGQYTAQQGPGFAQVPGTGHSVADFLLGQVLGAGVTSAGGNGDYLDTNYSVFAQDEWRISPKLTLNLGVNWQYSGPYIEKYGRMSFPDFSAGAAAIGGRQLNTCNPVNAYNPVFNPGNNFGTIVDSSLCIKDPGKGAREYYDFQPRLGIAYRVRQNTVVRTGLGIFFDNPQWASEMAGMSGDPPFPLFLSLNSKSFVTTDYPLDTLLPPQSQLNGQATGRLVGPTLADRRMPYTYEYNVSVEHQFTSNNLLEVGYIGTASHHLQMGNVPVNQARPDLPGVTTPIVSRLPWPAFGGVGGLALTERAASAAYNAGFVKFERRFSKGLSLLGSFTWSHDVGWPVGVIAYVAGGPSSSIQNGKCLNCDRGNVDEDVPKRFALSALYQLPIGPGKPFLSNATGVLSQFVGGWQVNTIAAVQSGLPISCSDPRDTANVGFGSRCDYAPGHSTPPPSQNFQTTGYAFNPSYFALKAPGEEFGNTGRNILRTGRTNNIDFSIFKDFRLAESKTLQFRAEFFNAFNITQFISPDITINDPGFGKYIPSTSLAAPATAPARQIQLALKLIF